MPLFTKCLTCGGWRPMPENPATQNQVPTGFIMNVSKPPADLCSCEDGPAEMKLGAR